MNKLFNILWGFNTILVTTVFICEIVTGSVSSWLPYSVVASWTVMLLSFKLINNK